MARSILIWAALAVAVSLPLFLAATSPLLAWREPIYIAAGFAGILAMALLLIQPLLAGGYLPGFTGRRHRQAHRITGVILVLLVLAHVAGLWVTSPPDMIDALLFASPTPFSAWGVVAMWALLAAALLAALRHRLSLKFRQWRRAHTSLVLVVVAASVVHAVLIDGTMEWLSKVALCTLTLTAATMAVFKLRIWSN